ncbi:indian hedgehog B protein-like [Macrobrachium rosenbergii]|uniref:indian hedgehog B protein-like n=1 Tax=Macrobrachium rosenbergii TaxID=79674 RepID=UPI0034D510AF
MRTYRGRERTWAASTGIALRAALLLGVFMGVIYANPGRPDSMSFSDVLSLLEEQTHVGGSGNRDASVDYLRHSGNVMVSCKSRGLCNCYSKALRRSFCCDCLNGPCFPADARATTPQGEVRMADLQIGDMVLAGNDNGDPVWSPLVAWLDRRPKEEAQYLSISTEGGPQLTLSSSHLLFTSNDNQLLPRFSGEVSENERLLMLSEKFQLSTTSTPEHQAKKVMVTNITNITPVLKQGAYVPLTQTGTIFVNNILASCYASVTHDIAHTALAPVRWFPSWMAKEGQYEGTMPYVQLLKWFARRFLPTRYLAPKDFSLVVEPLVEEKAVLSCPPYLDLVNNALHVFITSV